MIATYGAIRGASLSAPAPHTRELSPNGVFPIFRFAHGLPHVPFGTTATAAAAAAAAAAATSKVPPFSAAPRRSWMTS